jgi:hypothetical protein
MDNVDIHSPALLEDSTFPKMPLKLSKPIKATNITKNLHKVSAQKFYHKSLKKCLPFFSAMSYILLNKTVLSHSLKPCLNPGWISKKLIAWH